MRRSIEIAAGFLIAFLVIVPVQQDALVDDFEQDFWLPFTHFHLGDRASAGYSDAFAHSGARSYRVEIHGWAVRDFGSAYGYAVFSTGGTSLGELRLSLLYDVLQDADPSPWDAFTAGVSLELLTAGYASLGTFRYVSAYRASQNAGRCAPTLSDVVLADRPTLGEWQDLGRNPATDFAAAPWNLAAYVKISVGFLCASGLTGAEYSLFFDDFAIESNGGDADGDGLRDLEEETRVHAVQLSEPDVPIPVPAPGTASMTLVGPSVAGDLVSGFVAVDLVHPRPDDLSVSLALAAGDAEVSQLLWDPLGYERVVFITSPEPGRYLHGTVEVTGRVSPLVTAGWARLVVNGAPQPPEPRAADGAFTLDLSTDELQEGAASILVEVTGPEAGWHPVASSAPFPVLVDRTPPELTLASPPADAVVSGMVVISADAFDAGGIAGVELILDGTRVDSRQREPFEFVYETVDLTNAQHRIEVKATDAAGNSVTRGVSVGVSNRVVTPPPPCHPACNLTGGTTTGNLAPVRQDTRAWGLTLASGDRLEIADRLGVPWRPQVVRTPDGISLVLAAIPGPWGTLPEGSVAPELVAEDFARSGSWRILVRDHGADGSGFIQRASVRFAARTSVAQADTDGDGLSDGVERGMSLMSPVLADLDGDRLSDGWEAVPHVLVFAVDGEVRERTIITSPLEPDTDHDGLNDGDEVAPLEAVNLTDPNDPDTDGDSLTDGAERHVHGSDPTRTDTDGDTLRDDVEVTPRTLSLVVDGVPEERTVVTNPTLRDTDDDGLTDDVEWAGAEGWGLPTDPAEADTDRDGLSDGDELRGTNRRPTNPLVSDSDGDGLIDGIDMAPTETWDLPWSNVFAPGLVRFTQRIHALDVHGTYAGIWTYNVADDTCVFLSEHTADATRSSDESASSVGSWINKTFLEGGESNYTSLGMSYAGLDGSGYSSFERGACTLEAERKYIIEYRHDTHLWDVDFVNVAPVTVSDEVGTLLDHASFEIPIVPDTFQTLIVQISVRSEEDHGLRTPEGTLTVPILQYSLYKNPDFAADPPFYRGTAFGTSIHNHSYQFALRVPRDAVPIGNLSQQDGGTYAFLDVVPVWLRSSNGFYLKTALNATSITTGAIISKVEQSAECIVARLSANLSELNTALPSSMEGILAGLHGFGSFSVYAYSLGSVFDQSLVNDADAVWISGQTEADIAAFQTSSEWSPSGTWIRDAQDALGTGLAIMKTIRRGISLTSQLTSRLTPTALALPAWTWSELTYDRSFITATTLGNAIDWNPIYLITSTEVRTVSIQTFAPDIEYPTTSTCTFEWELGNAEVVEDIDDSILLSGSRHLSIRAGLRTAAVGVTLALFGTQAILAYSEGDLVKGTVYAAAGGVSALGIVRSDAVLGTNLFEGGAIRGGAAIKFGTLATIAVGGILASYEVAQGLASTASVEKLAHYETAAATLLDTSISVVPLYGPAFSIGWQLGMSITIGLQALFGMVPDSLAARITSSPGSTAVFLFEYILGGEIPSDISEDALTLLLSALNDAMRFWNSLDPPVATVVVAP